MDYINENLKVWINKFIDWDMYSEFKKTMNTMESLYSDKTIFPEKHNLLRVFKETLPENIKVVMIGMDPYPGSFNGKPSACGRAFATENGYVNPSLKNIIKELKDDIGNVDDPFDYSLSKWVEQGVFLYNTSLSLEEGMTGSHIYLWKDFTENLISNLSREYPDIVWILLGNNAKHFSEFIQSNYIVTAAHPSPLAKGMFFGSRIFSKTNNFLDEKSKIKW